MADYTYHGSGKVTVSPSKGQTGGSGMRSSGTYASEAAARSAVAAGTIQGAIETPAPAPMATVYDTLTGKPQQVSQKIAEAMVSQGSMRYSAAPATQPFTAPAPQSLSQAQQTYQPQTPTPYPHEVPRVLALSPIAPGLRNEVYEHPRFGKMIPASGAQKEKVLKSVVPAGITLSKESKGVMKLGKQAGDWIRGISPSEQFWHGGDAGKPVIELEDIYKTVRESVARIPEFISIIPGTVEVVGKAAIKDPLSVPKMAVVGGLYTVGSIAEQAEKEPFQLASDIIVTAGAFKLAKGVGGKVGETIKFTGKEFVPPEKIIEPRVLSGADRFPVAPKGTSATALVNEFKKGEYRLPGTEGKVGGWHATPEAFAKETVTQIGTSEGKGLYIAPSTSPHFWKISKDFKLFGFDNPPETPAGIWLQTGKVTRSPPSTRLDIAAQNRFLMQGAPKGTAYISAAFEKGIKTEKEAIIPPETPISRVRGNQYTKWEGKKVPLFEYQTTTKNLGLRDIMGNLPKGAESKIISALQRGGYVGVAGLTLGGMKPASAKQETYKDLVKNRQKIVSEYQQYKTPILTPGSLATSLAPKSKSGSKISVKKPSYKPLLSSQLSERFREAYMSQLTSARGGDYVFSGTPEISKGGRTSYTPPGQSPYRPPPYEPPGQPPYRLPPYEPPGTPPYKPPDYPGNRIIKLPKSPVQLLGKEMKASRFFHTYRSSPIMKSSTDLSGVRKALGLPSGKVQKGKKKKSMWEM